MRYLSLFSGIEAATQAWHVLGWRCVGVAEIEPFPCAVLAHYYPTVPNLGDVSKITEEDIAALGHVDLIVFGSPCQDLSVAGKRAGLEGARSGLFFYAVRIIGWAVKHCGLRWAVWENVPGAFSSNKGRDFAVVVGELAGAEIDAPPRGWGNEGALVGEKGMVEWTTLDAQWFGVAQRRRRVFAVADFGDWTGRPPVLLESDSLRGDSAPRREAGETVTPTIRAGAASGSRGHGARSGDSKDELIVGVGPGVNTHPPVALCLNAGGMRRIDAESETLITSNGCGFDVAPTIRAGGNRTDGDRPPGTDVDTADSLIVTHSLRADGFDASEDGTGRGTPLVPIVFDTTQITSPGNYSSPKAGDPCHPLAAGAHPPAIAFNWQENKNFRESTTTTTTNPLKVSQTEAVTSGMRVRRLIPRECERLQGFPDDYTYTPYRGKPAADGPALQGARQQHGRAGHALDRAADRSGAVG